MVEDGEALAVAVGKHHTRSARDDARALPLCIMSKLYEEDEPMWPLPVAREDNEADLFVCSRREAWLLELQARPRAFARIFALISPMQTVNAGSPESILPTNPNPALYHLWSEI